MGAIAAAGAAIGGKAAGIAGIGAKVAGGLASAGGASRAAAAQEQQAAMHWTIAQENAQVMLGRSKTALGNASHAQWLAGFVQQQTALQNQINARIGESQWHAARKYASVIQDAGRAKGKALDKAAKSTEAFGKEDIRRHTRQGRLLQGQVRGAIAASGITESGSPLEVQADVAGQLELEALDILTKTQGQAQDLRYQADLAEWEGDMQHAQIHYQSDMARWDTNIKIWTASQQAAIQANDYMMQATNHESQSEDYRSQAHIALLEGWSQSGGLMAQAQGTRAQGRAALFGAVAGGIKSGIGLARNA